VFEKLGLLCLERFVVAFLGSVGGMRVVAVPSVEALSVEDLGELLRVEWFLRRE
jgi:hypothetical protein